MELSVLKIDGSESGKKVVLDEKIFGLEPNDHAIYLDVIQYLAHQRQGTARTKDRSEVSYSTKKQGRQKGGGRAHGPKPRCYDMKLNKKLKQLARFSALSYKAKENKIVMVEPFAMEAPKTKEFLNILSAIKAGDRKVLFVLPENSANIYLSSRNLEQVKVISVDEINTYTIMNAHSMVLVDGVQDILASRVRR